RTSSTGTSSPPTIMISTGQLSGTPVSARSVTQRRHSATGASTAVTPCPAQNRTSSAPSSRAGSGWMTSVPPEVSTGNRSPTEASNVRGGSIGTRGPGPKPCASTNERLNSATAPCGTTTPLGSPVDPDVKITYAGSPGRRFPPATSGPCGPAGGAGGGSFV